MNVRDEVAGSVRPEKLLGGSERRRKWALADAKGLNAGVGVGVSVSVVAGTLGDAMRHTRVNGCGLNVNVHVVAAVDDDAGVNLDVVNGFVVHIDDCCLKEYYTSHICRCCSRCCCCCYQQSCCY